VAISISIINKMLYQYEYNYKSYNYCKLWEKLQKGIAMIVTWWSCG